MNDSRRRRLMFALLIGSVLFGLCMKPWERRRSVVAPSADGAVPVTVSEASMASSVAPSAPLAVDWPSRDPFAQPGEFAHRKDEHLSAVHSAPVPELSLPLQGIMTVGGTKSCVIGGEVRCVGATVQGWMIADIVAEGIWVSQAGQRLFVPLK